MIRFHPHISLMEAAQALDAAALVLLPDWNGGALIVRRADALRAASTLDQGVFNLLSFEEYPSPSLADPLIRHIRALPPRRNPDLGPHVPFVQALADWFDRGGDDEVADRLRLLADDLQGAAGPKAPTHFYWGKP